MSYFIAFFLWFWCRLFGAGPRTVGWFLKTPQWKKIQNEVETSRGETGRYKQRVRSKKGWLDYQIDEWLGPDGKGWQMCIHAKSGIVVVSSKGEIG